MSVNVAVERRKAIENAMREVYQLPVRALGTVEGPSRTEVLNAIQKACSDAFNAGVECALNKLEHG